MPPIPDAINPAVPTAHIHLTLADLDRAIRRLIAARISLDGAADRAVSKALDLRDPHGNGVEPRTDRPPERSPPCPDGSLAIPTRPLDRKARAGPDAGTGRAAQRLCHSPVSPRNPRPARASIPAQEAPS